MAEPLDLLAIGEVMAEIRQDADVGFQVGFAGDTYNTAVYCARARGRAGSVAYFSRVGTDPLSEQFMKQAEAEDLDTRYITSIEERPIGIYAVATDATGERSFSYWRDSSAARTLFAEADENLPVARITYLSGITLAIMEPSARRRLMDKLAKLSSTGETQVAFDSNYRPKLWENADVARDVMDEMWALTDIALPSVDDEMALFGDSSEGDVVKRFASRAWKACAIKRGVQGPISPTLPQRDTPRFTPAPKVVDTTAAGDSFNAGYLAAFLDGETEQACMLAGHALAKLVVASPGAIIAR
ncbi:sugar kinase [Pseudahrensia aquimaris]|uniref:Sugar kinase n=1 Tax=Pseudahrensia aquimaris TaxID=744461 RepID=A0ABW3FKD9_9HYPH